MNYSLANITTIINIIYVSNIVSKPFVFPDELYTQNNGANFTTLPVSIYILFTPDHLFDLLELEFTDDSTNVKRFELILNNNLSIVNELKNKLIINKTILSDIGKMNDINITILETFDNKNPQNVKLSLKACLHKDQSTTVLTTLKNKVITKTFHPDTTMASISEETTNIFTTTDSTTQKIYGTFIFFLKHYKKIIKFFSLVFNCEDGSNDVQYIKESKSQSIIGRNSFDNKAHDQIFSSNNTLLINPNDLFYVNYKFGPLSHIKSVKMNTNGNATILIKVTNNLNQSHFLVII